MAQASPDDRGVGPPKIDLWTAIGPVDRIREDVVHLCYRPSSVPSPDSGRSIVTREAEVVRVVEMVLDADPESARTVLDIQREAYTREAVLIGDYR